MLASTTSEELEDFVGAKFNHPHVLTNAFGLGRR